MNITITIVHMYLYTWAPVATPTNSPAAKLANPVPIRVHFWSGANPPLDALPPKTL